MRVLHAGHHHALCRGANARCRARVGRALVPLHGLVDGARSVGRSRTSGFCGRGGTGAVGGRRAASRRQRGAVGRRGLCRRSRADERARGRTVAARFDGRVRRSCGREMGRWGVGARYTHARAKCKAGERRCQFGRRCRSTLPAMSRLQRRGSIPRIWNRMRRGAIRAANPRRRSGTVARSVAKNARWRREPRVNWRISSARPSASCTHAKTSSAWGRSGRRLLPWRGRAATVSRSRA